MYQRFAGLGGIAVTFALFGSLHWLIHPVVRFPVRIKECYVTPLDQARTRFCARCCLRVEMMILARRLPTSENLVDHRAQPVRQNARSEPTPRVQQKPALLRYAVPMGQDAEVWRQPKTRAKRSGCESAAVKPCDYCMQRLQRLALPMKNSLPFCQLPLIQLLSGGAHIPCNDCSWNQPSAPKCK
jgi:hypothetical protein